MGFSRKKFSILFFLVICLIAAAFYLPVDIPYTVNTKVMLKPLKEWELVRNSDGSMSSILRNHKTGNIESFSYNEFQRGDAVHFETNPAIAEGMHVGKGDTIGFIVSNEMQLRVIELEGQLGVLKAELAYYVAGQKPEDIETAKRELKLAEQELETQKKLMNRSESLVRDSIISQQQYELDQNQLQVKMLAKSIAEARLSSIVAGDKPEQIKLSQSRIKMLEEQLVQLRERMHAFVITAPMDGTILIQRNFGVQEWIIKLADMSSFIGVAPVMQHDLQMIAHDSPVFLPIRNQDKAPDGIVTGINNVLEPLEGYIVVYVLVEIENKYEGMMPGGLEGIKISGRNLNPREYFWRKLNTPV